MVPCKRILLLFFSIQQSFAQHGTGLSIDSGTYRQGEIKAAQTRGVFVLPSKCSLKSYAPPAGDQGQTSESASWACAYAARAIAESKAAGRTDPTFILNHAYSPAILHRLTAPGDTTCSRSLSLGQVLETFKYKGDLTWTDRPESCIAELSQMDQATAVSFTIKDYYRLYNEATSAADKIGRVKQCLLSGRPVITGLLCPPSLFVVKDIWKPQEDVASIRTGQAVCIVGYDDGSNGGAFEFLNSWGPGWGRNGFAWVTYRDFLKYGLPAYTLINIPPAKPSGIVDDFSPDVTGDFVIKTDHNDTIPVNLVSREGGIVIYKTGTSLTAGGRFRIAVNTWSPEYVYILDFDQSLQANVLFPFDANTSAALDDSVNRIEYPSNAGFFRVDRSASLHYLCLICSKDELRTQKIVADIGARTEPDLSRRLAGVFRERLLPGRNMWVEKDRISSKGISSERHILFINIIEYQSGE